MPSSHAIALLRAAPGTSLQAEEAFLLAELDKMPVSVYSLPVHNIFDFALVGAISEVFFNTLVNKKRAGNIERFDQFKFLAGDRHMTLGKIVLEPNVKYDNDSTVVGKFHAMLLLHFANVHNFERRREFLNGFKRLLGQFGWNDTICAASISPIRELSRPAPELPGRIEFLTDPVDGCTCWIRFSRNLAAGESAADSLNKLHDLHFEIRHRMIPDVTSYCFPVLPRRIAESEALHPRSLCYDSLKGAFGPESVPMLWFGFHRQNDESGALEPDVRLPLGHFVVSAKGGVGKTNGAIAVMNAFLRWRGQLADTPGIQGFDVVYINLKSKPIAEPPTVQSDAVTETNEAKILKAVLAKSGFSAECVRPEDLVKFFGSHDKTKGAIAYTEPQAVTKWSDLAVSIGNVARMRQRGVLFVVDEAFSTNLTEAARADIQSFYTYVFDEGRAKGLRLVFIGQQPEIAFRALNVSKSAYRFSTLIFGSQDEDDKDVLKNLLVRSGEPWATHLLECGTIQGVNDIATRENIPYKMGPVIVCPSLFGRSSCHAVPCHVRPISLTREEREGPDVGWWKG